MRTVNYVVVCAVVLAALSVNVHGAFLTEAHETGVARENFLIPVGVLEVKYSSLASFAPGLEFWGTAEHSLFTSDETPAYYDFPYIYTPAFDVDNFFSSEGFDLANGHLSSGLIGGAPGLYNVYITWPESTNVEGDCKITVSNDGPEVVLDVVDMNTGGTGDPGGNDGWFRIAEQIHLTTGTTYTIHQIALAPSGYPIMRSHGVLWELVEADPQQATLTESDGTTDVTEGGVTDTYTVALKEAPLSDIVVTVESLDPNQLWLNGQLGTTLELTFTPGNWDQGQPIMVEAFDDLDFEGDHSVMVLHSIMAEDPNDEGFGGLVTVNITDNDGPDIRITESDEMTAVSEEGSTSDDYMVKLLYPPTDDVTIIIETDGQVLVFTGTGPGPSTTAELKFTENDWEDYQAVTVTAVDDDVLEGTHISEITHIAESRDDVGYDGLAGRNVAVSVDDNECGAWGFTAMDFDTDCVVGIADFAEFAAEWLVCTQPYGDSCIDLR
jgi:hypothetical protein